MRTWPAIELGRLEPVPTAEAGRTGAGVSQPDLVQAALVDYKIAAIDETASDRWRVFFSTAAERDRAAGQLRRQFPDLAIDPLDLPDEDWVARSQATLGAIRVGNIIVAPPWDVPHPGRVSLDAAPAFAAAGLRRPVVIVVNPSVGFGTGHHATTRLCLAAMQRLSLNGRSVVDVGTGSGVLALAASRLGATPVEALDDDELAAQAAQENLTINRGARVVFRVSDLRSLAGSPFDVVLANLTGALLVGAAARLRAAAAPHGHLILSGFLQHEETAVLAAYAADRPVHRSEEEGWVCVTLQRV